MVAVNLLLILSMPPIFSFIIVNFNSAHSISLCLASLHNTHLKSHEYEVIVVNNDVSETKALEMLQAQHSFKLIHTHSNIGFGAACNKGATHALGNILGFINPDAQFISGNVREIHTQFECNPSVGIIGLKLLTGQGDTQAWSAGVRVTLWDILRNNLGFPKSKSLWRSQVPITVDWVSGASLFIPRDLFTSVHGFDTRFFLYFEDNDLCERILKQKKSILYFPFISIRHTSGQSSSSKKQQKYDYYKSQTLYFSLHRPKWEGWCIKTLRNIF